MAAAAARSLAEKARMRVAPALLADEFLDTVASRVRERQQAEASSDRHRSSAGSKRRVGMDERGGRWLEGNMDDWLRQ